MQDEKGCLLALSTLTSSIMHSLNLPNPSLHPSIFYTNIKRVDKDDLFKLFITARETAMTWQNSLCSNIIKHAAMFCLTSQPLINDPLYSRPVSNCYKVTTIVSIPKKRTSTLPSRPLHPIAITFTFLKFETPHSIKSYCTSHYFQFPYKLCTSILNAYSVFKL